LLETRQISLVPDLVQENVQNCAR